MQSLKAVLALGALLSAGMLVAQQAGPSQAPAPSASQAAPQESAPDQSIAAQPVPPPYRQHAPNPDKQARRLAMTLGLSRDQVAQIKPILADRIQQMQSLRADASLDPPHRRQETRQIMRDSKAKIEAVLNDSQRQQYEQLLAQRRARHNVPAQAPQS